MLSERDEKDDVRKISNKANHRFALHPKKGCQNSPTFCQRLTDAA